MIKTSKNINRSGFDEYVLEYFHYFASLKQLKEFCKTQKKFVMTRDNDNVFALRVRRHCESIGLRQQTGTAIYKINNQIKLVKKVGC